jgi:hypothetical protein
MDKQAALDALTKRCFDARVPVYKVCDRAGVARSTPSRWKSNPDQITASTLGKLEDALTLIETEKATA